MMIFEYVISIMAGIVCFFILLIVISAITKTIVSAFYRAKEYHFRKHNTDLNDMEDYHDKSD